MKQWDREEHIRREAKAEGKAEGKVEGKAETKEEDGLATIRFGRKHNISDDEIRKQLRDEMKLKDEDIDDLFDQADAEKRKDK